MSQQEIPNGVYISQDIYLRKGEIEEAVRAYIHTWGRADLMLFIEEVLVSYPIKEEKR